MRRDVFVYLSGPMTAKFNRTIEQNVANAIRFHLSLLNAGIPNFCPHLSGAFPTAWSAVEYETWLAYDFAVIDRCTHILMLPNWSESTGAVREHDYAVAKGLPIAYTDLELLQMLASAPSEAA